MRREERFKENIESLVLDMGRAVDMINELSPQPELGLNYSFDLGLNSLALKVDSSMKFDRGSVGNLRKRYIFEEEIEEQKESALAEHDAIVSLLGEINETAKAGEDYYGLVDLLTQLNVKAYRNQVEFNNEIDVKNLLSDIEFMKEGVAKEQFIAKGQKESWDPVYTYLYNLSEKYNSRKMRLPKEYGGKMDLRTIAVMMFQGDIPEGVLPKEVQEDEVVLEKTETLSEKVKNDSPSRTIQEKIARRRLERAYSRYGEVSEYDITPEEAAQRTLDVLVPEGKTYSPLSVLGMTTRYIEELMDVHDSAWITENPTTRKPMLNSLALKVESMLWNPNNLSLEKRKEHIQNRYNRTKDYVAKKHSLTVAGL